MTPWAKRLAIALAVSIGVNLLLAGVLIGRGFRHPHGRGPRHDDIELGVRGERRHPILREAMKPRRAELAAQRAAIGQARAAVREALGREPFDRAALERALEAVRAETTRGQATLHAGIVDAAAGATPERRRELARGWGSKPK